MISINGQKIDFTSFPNGETKVNDEQVQGSLLLGRNQIDFKYESDSDLIRLMFVKNYIDQLGKTAFLRILYMPYSRMDRSVDNSAFTLKYVSAFINSLNFENVTVIEPHSDVTPALLDRCLAVYPTFDLLSEVVQEVGFNKEKDYLFFPDGGAQKRYGKIKGYKQIVGYKDRDFKSGNIIKLDIVGNVDETNKVIILDDLSSYGTTFVKSAEKLKEIGFKEIYLLVGHCEKSIYKGKVFESGLIDRVFTTDTMQDESEHEKLHIYHI